MGHLASYPKVYNLGHAQIAALFDDPVTIEEKVDGSQFSFGMREGVLRCRSKNCEIVEGAEGMFELGVETAKRLAPKLVEGWTYRAEFLRKPKHNALAYDRVPDGNIILFDVDKAIETYVSWEEKAEIAASLGLECIPRLSTAKLTTVEEFKALLDTVSCLGGQKVEGVVIKNYSRFAKDGKALMGKYVSERFREIHKSAWKKEAGAEIRQGIVNGLRTESRWEKAIQHLRDAGALTDSPRDIGELVKEVARDVAEECADEIKDALFKWAWKDIHRGVTRGLPEWYKERLLEKQFDSAPESTPEVDEGGKDAH